MIDVLQPCVSFNKLNTYEWYNQRICKVERDKGYDPLDRSAALAKAGEWPEKIPLGIIYRKESRTYGEKCRLENIDPLAEHPIDNININSIIKDFA